jgi:hypothetical protein
MYHREIKEQILKSILRILDLLTKYLAFLKKMLDIFFDICLEWAKSIFPRNILQA